MHAKAKIKQARLRFELPGAEDMPQRLGDVLDAAYAACGSNWDAVDGANSGARGLADEALFLVRLLVLLLPAEPEARGLLPTPRTRHVHQRPSHRFAADTRLLIGDAAAACRSLPAITSPAVPSAGRCCRH